MVYWWYEPDGADCQKTSPCSRLVSKSDSEVLLNLVAGEDYTFYIQTESNSLRSQILVINQPTFTDDTVDGPTGLQVLEALERQLTFEINFKSGTGARIQFSYLGQISASEGIRETPFL